MKRFKEKRQELAGAVSFERGSPVEPLTVWPKPQEELSRVGPLSIWTRKRDRAERETKGYEPL